MKVFILATLAATGVSAFTPRVIESRADRLEVKRSDNGFSKRQSAGEEYPITLFHVNDVHAHLDEFRTSGADCTDPTKGCVGGVARVKEKLQELRPGKNNSLWLNAGDEFQGTLFFGYYGAEKIAEAMNDLNFDVFVPGNHEWDRGDDHLSQFIHNITVPTATLCANLVTSHEGLNESFVPYHIFEEHSLAVIGVTTPETVGISKPGPGTTFTDPVAAAQAAVDHIQATTDIKRIIAVTHIGYDNDKLLAEATKGIDAIIGGHSHTLLGNFSDALGSYPTIATNLDGQAVPIVTSAKWGRYLGVIDLVFDANGDVIKYEGAPIELTNQTAQEPELQAKVDEWRVPFDEFGKQVVGETKQTLDQTTCQLGECTLGDLVADATVAYYLNATSSNASASILNAGGVRASIDAGPITITNVLTSFPFGNLVCAVTFTGADLWKIFEGIVSKVNQFNQKAVTSFVQVSKEVRFTYNPNNANGTRLISLNIGETNVTAETQEQFTIVTWDFLATGGDNFWTPQTCTTLDAQDQALIQYLQANSPVDINLDGRIATTEATSPASPSEGSPVVTARARAVTFNAAGVRGLLN